MAGAPVPTVAPALMVRAFDILADQAGRTRRGKIDPKLAAVRAWTEFREDDVDPDGPAFAEGVAELAALARRLSALGDMLERIEPGSLSLEVMAETACDAPVFEIEGAPRFQYLDFLARAQRVAGNHAVRGCSCCS